jgi:hypothetical protein
VPRVIPLQISAMRKVSQSSAESVLGAKMRRLKPLDSKRAVMEHTP